jgi:hypothetical protein
MNPCGGAPAAASTFRWRRKGEGAGQQLPLGAEGRGASRRRKGLHAGGRRTVARGAGRGPASKTEREHRIIGVRPTATILGGPRPRTLALAPRARFTTIDTLRRCSDNENVASKWSCDNQLRMTADGVGSLLRLAAVAGIEALQSQKTPDPFRSPTRHVAKPPKSPD